MVALGVVLDEALVKAVKQTKPIEVLEGGVLNELGTVNEALDGLFKEFFEIFLGTNRGIT